MRSRSYNRGDFRTAGIWMQRADPSFPKYMRVLMLGWEYPPHIAGGLGRACEGLTVALAKHEVDIHFVVPHLFGEERATHMVLTDSLDTPASANGDIPSNGFRADIERASVVRHADVTTSRVPAFLAPYWTPSTFKERVTEFTRRASHSVLLGKTGDAVARALIEGEVFGVDPRLIFLDDFPVFQTGSHYGSDIFAEVERFTAHVVALMSNEQFDVVHAHDWMTFPAAVAISQIARKPLIVHIHSLEYDRSGVFVNEQINQIERFGLQAADKIIAVSYYTQRSIERFHNIPKNKIAVVHNGVYPRAAVENYRVRKTWPRHVVLFLGRVTYQKGPDYFVEVATRVIPHVPDVLFVLAGSGDMLEPLVRRVEELKLTDHFLFPGFLKGEDVEEMFSLADLYVMPSVSEPFGLAALEAINFDTPVIVSRQSGVSEVIDNALKADFWDLDRLADLIINSLLHEELRQDMAVMAKEEVKQLHWDAAALKTLEVYQDVAH